MRKIASYMIKTSLQKKTPHQHLFLHSIIPVFKSHRLKTVLFKTTSSSVQHSFTAGVYFFCGREFHFIVRAWLARSKTLAIMYFLIPYFNKCNYYNCNTYYSVNNMFIDVFFYCSNNNSSSKNQCIEYYINWKCNY